nr:integrase, catalytic region, zinc finger, CCHC-type, peptidase aspartic, catalytic [Tanacetum cinerariifolium]
MANLSKDIQCAGSDTQPLMLDRTDFASWQQRIRLYCRGKDNGVNILKSIDEGPYKLGTFRETLAESTEGTPQFGLERPHVYSNLNSEEKDRGQEMNPQGGNVAGYGQAHNRVRNVNQGQARPDVDEAPTAQTMFMANLSSADPIPMKPDHLMIRIFCQ